MIEYLWPTPVLQEQAPFTQEQISSLKAFAEERYANHKSNPPEQDLPDVQVLLRPQYNLFQAHHEEKAPEVWPAFKEWADSLYRRYLQEAHGVRNAQDLRVVARCTPACYEKGMRAQPHYHHTGDHVMCLYLSCGENRKPYAERGYHTGDGELILQDPRPMAGFPFWEKVKYIETKPGLVVLHPSRVWHESNAFNSESGDRTLLVVTYRVVSHNYTELYEPL